MYSNVGILFDIAQLGEGLYGYAAYQIFFNAVDTRWLAGCTLRDGDTSETLAGRANQYCIAVESLDDSSISKVKTALNGSNAKGLLPLASRFMEGTLVSREPLVTAAQINAAGELIGCQTGWVTAAWQKSREKHQSTESADIPSENLIPEAEQPAAPSSSESFLFPQRIGRVSFLVRYVIFFCVLFPAAFMTKAAGQSEMTLSAVAGVVLLLALIYYQIHFILIARVRDTGLHAAFTFLIFIPLLGSLMFLALFFIPAEMLRNADATPGHRIVCAGCFAVPPALIFLPGRSIAGYAGFGRCEECGKVWCQKCDVKAGDGTYSYHSCPTCKELLSNDLFGPEPNQNTQGEADLASVDGALSAVIIIFNRDFSPKETYVNSILTKMKAHGRPYRDWMKENTPMRILVNPKAQDPMTFAATGMVEFRRLIGDTFDLEKMEHATFEGSVGISGVILTHWDIRESPLPINKGKQRIELGSDDFVFWVARKDPDDMYLAALVSRMYREDPAQFPRKLVKALEGSFQVSFRTMWKEEENRTYVWLSPLT